MRKLSFFLTFALVLTLAYGALAQPTNVGIITLDNVTNQVSASQLRAGSTHVASIRYNFTGCLASPPWWIGSTAYEIYSPDGANWVNLLAADGPLTTALAPSVARARKYFTSANSGASWTQTGSGGTLQPGPSTGIASRVGYALTCIDAFGTAGWAGGPGGSNGIAMTLEFETLVADEGLTMCVDSVNGKGTVAWEWAHASDRDWPKWDNGLGVSGPRCYEIFVVPNIRPIWCGNPPVEVGNVIFNHCDEGTFDLCATDGGDGPGPMSYAFAPGQTPYGNLNTSNGHWTWSGPTVPQAANVDIEFQASDGADTTVARFVLHVTTTNRAPTISCPGSLTIPVGQCKTQTVTVNDLDLCDTKTVTLVSVDGAVGTVTLTGNALEFCPVAADAAGPSGPDFEMLVAVSDGTAADTCAVPWHVIVGSPYQILMAKDSATIQGQFHDLPISLISVDPNQGLGGFDFLVAYDASALAFQLAFEGAVYDNCGWEYFTYRFGAYGNCGSGCPSGLLRVIGMAETNNGGYHPGCHSTGVGYVAGQTFPLTLAYLRFLVSQDLNLNCQFVPVRFFWYDCGDNTLSNFDGSELYLSEKVYDFTEYNNPFVNGLIPLPGTWPSYGGALDGCVYDTCKVVSIDRRDPQHPDTTWICKVAKRNVDFQNGGFDIICSDSIDARGDINLNGLAYEIADAVMFTNYFVNGLAAFGTHQAGSIAASDTNADGLALTVSDLVYLIRVIVGDAQPYDKSIPVAANLTVNNGVFNVDGAMGAAHIVVSGNVTPTLLADNMEMKSGFDGQNTNILVYSMEPNQSFSGNFLRADGDVVKTDLATFTGQPVVAKVMPADFALRQNYPNPFNPSTKIDILIPRSGVEWKLNVYNITGQLVESFSGVSQSGFESVIWDASGVSSGVYFYKLTAGDFSDTKKAVLLK